jgi:proteasome accessory factor A
VAANHDSDEEAKRVVAEWRHVLEQLVSDPMSLDRQLDWVTKHQLIERYQAKHDLPLGHPRVQMLDLAYHDVVRDRGLYHLLARSGPRAAAARRDEIEHATEHPPETHAGRAAGPVHPPGQGARRDYTVDWVHLKLNDQAQRTVLCKDPFRYEDERVDKLIASM